MDLGDDFPLVPINICENNDIIGIDGSGNYAGESCVTIDGNVSEITPRALKSTFSDGYYAFSIFIDLSNILAVGPSDSSWAEATDYSDVKLGQETAIYLYTSSITLTPIHYPYGGDGFTDKELITVAGNANNYYYSANVHKNTTTGKYYVVFKMNNDIGSTGIEDFNDLISSFNASTSFSNAS